MAGSVFLNHHLGSFDDSGNGVAFLEFEFVGAAAGDDTLNDVVPDSNDHMGHVSIGEISPLY